MLRDAREVPSIHRAIVLTSGNNSACLSLLENAGFVYAGSIKRKTRLGRHRVWAEGAERLAAAASQTVESGPPEQPRIETVQSQVASA
jgi:hypothetical protein